VLRVHAEAANSVHNQSEDRGRTDHSRAHDANFHSLIATRAVLGLPHSFASSADDALRSRIVSLYGLRPRTEDQASQCTVSHIIVTSSGRRRAAAHARQLKGSRSGLCRSVGGWRKSVPQGPDESSPVRSAGLAFLKSIRPGRDDRRMLAIAEPRAKPKAECFYRP
jgi:hypothetical protein